MKKNCKSAYRLLFGLLLALFPVLAYGKDIPLSEVPKVVIEAAKKAIPGFEIHKAEKEREWGRLVYELEGVSTADGERYEIELTRKGKVLEIEKGEEGGDDD